MSNTYFQNKVLSDMQTLIRTLRCESGGSGIFYFKEPKTGKTISVDVSGSVNTIKQVGEELSKKYNVDPKQLQFLYHDMGSYSAKPKSHNGVLSNEQWQNYNVNNKGYSGAALMYPMEFGGMAASDILLKE